MFPLHIDSPTLKELTDIEERIRRNLDDHHCQQQQQKEDDDDENKIEHKWEEEVNELVIATAPSGDHEYHQVGNRVLFIKIESKNLSSFSPLKIETKSDSNSTNLLPRNFKFSFCSRQPY